MKLEFLLCGSHTDAFFSQIAFFRYCLNQLSGAYKRARVVAVLGDHHEERIPDRWITYFRSIEIYWAHEPGAENPGHFAQHIRRYELIDPSADVSFLCDSDIAILRTLDPLIRQLQAKPALVGIIAHYHFPWDERPRDPDIDWPEISNAVIGKNIDRPYRYSLMPMDTSASAPFYINYGVFGGPPSLLAEFHRRDIEIEPLVAEYLGHWWAPQVSLALTCADLGLPTLALPLRYNFPNDPIADTLYPDELTHVVFLHYLREDLFRRGEIFAGKVAFEGFLKMELVGSNAVFQRFVRSITQGTFPFPA